MASYTNLLKRRLNRIKMKPQIYILHLDVFFIVILGIDNTGGPAYRKIGGDKLGSTHGRGILWEKS